MRKYGERYRSLWDVKQEELHQAIIDLCLKLGIAGSIGGSYDLYTAINNEYEKSKGDY